MKETTTRTIDKEAMRSLILLDMEMGVADQEQVDWLVNYERDLAEEKYFENIR